MKDRSTMNLNTGWHNILQSEFDKPYMRELTAFVAYERKSGKQIYPAEENVFAAFNHTGFADVRVVILGQDPYHGPGQAHGLSFSVPRGVRIPPSLRNIYQEIERDLGIAPPTHGNLTGWARQGVLLLNAVLTVEQARAASHSRRGWEAFTDAAIAALNDRRAGLVFMLWGAYAQKKGAFINTDKHLVLESPHPSPLSAHRGFLGNGHFSAANKWLSENEYTPIDWSVAP